MKDPLHVGGEASLEVGDLVVSQAGGAQELGGGVGDGEQSRAIIGFGSLVDSRSPTRGQRGRGGRGGKPYSTAGPSGSPGCLSITVWLSKR